MSGGEIEMLVANGKLSQADETLLKSFQDDEQKARPNPKCKLRVDKENFWPGLALPPDSTV
jgi:hypothetical protein